MSISYAVLEIWDHYLNKYLSNRPVPSIGMVGQGEIVAQRQEQPAEVELVVQIPLDTLARNAVERLKSLKNLVIPGFRSGKAPIRLLSRRLNYWLLAETLEDEWEQIWQSSETVLPGQLISTVAADLDAHQEGEVDYLMVTFRCEVLTQLEMPAASEQISEEKILAALHETILGTVRAGQQRMNRRTDAPTERSEHSGEAAMDALCQKMEPAVPVLLVDQLTKAIKQVVTTSIDDAVVKESLKRRLHRAQVSQAILNKHKDLLRGLTS